MSLASRLNRLITIEQQSTAQDSVGQPVLAWDIFVQAWAEVKDISGREYLSANAERSEVQTRITIRYVSGISEAMRVVNGSDIYNIKAILGQDKRTLILMCARAL